MTRNVPLPGGDLEYAALVVLWERGRASARDVHEQVGERAGLAYTTIATVLDRLHDKRLVTREKVGKTFVYRPALDREVVERARATSTLRRILGEPSRPAIATLVDAIDDIDPELLDEFTRLARAKRRSRRGP